MTADHLLLFASTFISVFALGFQSLNVRGDHYLAAFMTSFVIGVGNLFILRLVPDADAGLIAAYLLGGPFGIVSSMWAHKRTVGKPAPRKKNPQACRDEATKNVVRVAASLYECQDSAKTLLGEKYPGRMALYGEWIKKRSAHTNANVLSAAQDIIKEVGPDDRVFAIQMLAAAVELIEPSEELAT